MIASFIDGRVRLRHEALKDSAKMSMVEAFVKSQNGVLSTISNPRTGSLLVEYDPGKIPRASLMLAAQALRAQLGIPSDDGCVGEGERRKKAEGCILSVLLNHKSEMLLLTGSMAATLVGGVANRRLHLAAGALFALLTAGHMYKRRGGLNFFR